MSVLEKILNLEKILEFDIRKTAEKSSAKLQAIRKIEKQPEILRKPLEKNGITQEKIDSIIHNIKQITQNK